LLAMVSKMVETTRLVLVVKPLVVVGTTRLPPSYPALTIFGPLELPDFWARIESRQLGPAMPSQPPTLGPSRPGCHAPSRPYLPSDPSLFWSLLTGS